MNGLGQIERSQTVDSQLDSSVLEVGKFVNS